MLFTRVFFLPIIRVGRTKYVTKRMSVSFEICAPYFWEWKWKVRKRKIVVWKYWTYSQRRQTYYCIFRWVASQQASFLAKVCQLEQNLGLVLDLMRIWSPNTLDDWSSSVTSPRIISTSCLMPKNQLLSENLGQSEAALE